MQTIKLSISDYSQLTALQEFLRHATPGVKVTRISGRPATRAQGALDMLEVAADSTVLTAALNLIPNFLRSRKAGTKITAEGREKELEIEGKLSNEELKRIIDWFLDD